MAYIFVVTPFFNPGGPEMTKLWPSPTTPVGHCQFDLLRPDGVAEPYMDYVRDYLPLRDRIEQFHAGHISLLSEIPAFIDYSDTPAPAWWGGGGFKPGWYWLNQINSGSTIRVRPQGGQLQDRVKTITFDEEAAAAEGMPNFGIVVYPDLWSGTQPW